MGGGVGGRVGGGVGVTTGGPVIVIVVPSGNDIVAGSCVRIDHTDDRSVP